MFYFIFVKMLAQRIFVFSSGKYGLPYSVYPTVYLHSLSIGAVILVSTIPNRDISVPYVVHSMVYSPQQPLG